MNGKISEHVSIKEFTHSDTAIRYGIKNELDSTQFQRAKELCEAIFEPLRKFMGEPIKVNSGLRSLAINKRIGGSLTSQHMKGEALDLHLNAKGFYYIKDNLPFDQLIWEMGNDNEPQWVHVSFHKEHNRGQVLKAYKSAGKTKYKPFE